jgi:hypothetical protein
VFGPDGEARDGWPCHPGVQCLVWGPICRDALGPIGDQWSTSTARSRRRPARSSRK